MRKLIVWVSVLAFLALQAWCIDLPLAQMQMSEGTIKVDNPRHCLVLIWSRIRQQPGIEFSMHPSVHRHHWCGYDTEPCPEDLECPGYAVDVHVEHDDHMLDVADIVAFQTDFMLSHYDFPARRYSHQTWVGGGWEARTWAPLLPLVKDDPLFNMTIGYSRRYFQLHATFFPPTLEELLTPPFPKDSVNQAAVVSLVSGCGHGTSGRDAFIQELMQHIRVDSYGPCFHNKDLPPHLVHARESDRYPLKRALIRTYKFVLAFENTLDDDYVTEKLFHALHVGAVPVYMGAPNIRDIWPVPNSVILASDFASPAELATYLRHLDEHDELYNEYLTWKRRPLPEQVHALVRRSFRYTLCRACHWHFDRTDPVSDSASDRHPPPPS